MIYYLSDADFLFKSLFLAIPSKKMEKGIAYQNLYIPLQYR